MNQTYSNDSTRSKIPADPNRLSRLLFSRRSRTGGYRTCFSTTNSQPVSPSPFESQKDRRTPVQQSFDMIRQPRSLSKQYDKDTAKRLDQTIRRLNIQILGAEEKQVYADGAERVVNEQDLTTRVYKRGRIRNLKEQKKRLQKQNRIGLATPDTYNRPSIRSKYRANSLAEAWESSRIFPELRIDDVNLFVLSKGQQKVKPRNKITNWKYADPDVASYHPVLGQNVSNVNKTSRGFNILTGGKQVK